MPTDSPQENPAEPMPSAPEMTATESPGISRSRGSVLLIGSRIINALFNLVSVPILLSILGKPTFGAVQFALVVHGLMNLADIGTAEVVLRQMSRALATGDFDEVRELNRDQLGLNLLMGLAVVLVGLICGLTLSMDQGGIGRAEVFAIFCALGVQSFLYKINQSISTLLSSRQRFDLLSLAAGIGGIAVTVSCVAAVYATRRPWAYFGGMIVGELVILIVLARSAKKIGESALSKPALRWDRLKPTLRLCAIDYPNRASTYVAAWADKLMIGSAKLYDPLTDYRNSARLPDALRDMLNPLAATSLPVLSRDFHQSPSKFRENTLFSATTVFFACCLLMLVPAGFAVPLLHFWLGRFAPAEGEQVMIAMAVYQALQMYIAVVGYAFFAAAKRQFYIPMTAGNAILTLILTLPAYRAWGIAGIGFMNVGLGLAQTAGVWLAMRKIGFGAKETFLHALRVLAILACCLSFVFGGALLSRAHFLAAYPSLSLAFVPVVVVLAAAAILRVGLAELPDRLARRLPTRLAKILGK